MKISALVLVLVIGLLGACAPSSSLPASRTDRSTVVVQTNSGTTDMQLTRDAAISSASLAASPDEVWAALTRTYAQLEIPVTAVDQPARLLTSRERLRRIGGRSIARYLDCPGPYGNVAASGDVYVTLRSQVLEGEAASGSTLRHEVEAVARSSTGGSSQVRCTSGGSLEKLLTDTVQAQLQ